MSSQYGGPLAAEIGSLLLGTPANFNGFRVLAELLHGTLVVGVSQTLRCWTEVATYIRQGGHRVGQWSALLHRATVTSSQSNLTTSRIVASHERFSRIARWRNVHPI